MKIAIHPEAIKALIVTEENVAAIEAMLKEIAK